MIRLSWLALPLAATVIGLGGAAAATTKATLRLASANPVRVAGRGFHARERIRVTFSTGAARHLADVRASAAGTFSAGVAAATLPYDPCRDTLRINAAGSAGSRAALKLPPRECPPPA